MNHLVKIGYSQERPSRQAGGVGGWASSGQVGRAQPHNLHVPTGVIDDRGKFIYITPEELAAMANFIRQRGRVSITELAQASNSLIAWGREPPAQVPA